MAIIMDWILQDKNNSDISWGPTHRNLIEVLKENLPDIKLGVEIGVAYGSNSYNLLNNFSELKLYSIDPYVAYSDVDIMSNNTSGIKGNQLFEYTSNRLSSAFGERSVFYRETSDTAKDKFEDGSLDFVFVDGDHSFNGVTKDLNNMKSKIKLNGVLAGDDYGLFDVKPAVDKFCLENNKVLNIKGLVWWITM